MFVNLNNVIMYANSITPPCVNSPTLKVDTYIYKLIKAEALFLNSSYYNSYQYFKNFTEVCVMDKQDIPHDLIVLRVYRNFFKEEY